MRALEYVHTTVDGRRLLVTHGDAFDGVVLYHKWLAFLGDQAYSMLLRANIVFNAVRRRFHMPYWSLSAYMKKKVKNAVQFIGSYEEAVANEATSRGFDGVVCGHIHCAEIREFGGITYYNDGDWVESCTALAEDFTGHMSLIDWVKETGGHTIAETAAEEHAADKEATPEAVS
jgi:UDP-2,3-diacylglucosamine pyrophosphatase LpxH